MLLKFSEKIYYTKHRYTLLEPAIGYVRGENFSIMIDAGNSKEQVEKFLDELKEEGLPLPSYCILTHHHWDHSFGAYYIDAPLIATNKVKNELEKIATWSWDDDSMEERIKQRLDVPYSANILKKIYGDDRNINVKIPEIVKYGDMTLNIGDDKVICYYNDNSHSDGAFLIYIKEEKVLFIGDSHTKTYYTEPMSFDKEKLRSYIDVIKKIDFTHAIPGHGNVYSKEQLISTLENEYNKIIGG